MEDSDDERTTLAMAVARLGPGIDVGGYVIDGELGRGAMGVVYSATHPLIGKRAAIKVLKPELSKDPTVVERFALEARAVNQIRHPNIVDIFAFGALPDGRSYYIMDLLVGESLRARLKRTGAMHVSEVASAMDEAASALMAAHDNGIIHRDLKPDNVFMVTAPGRWPEVKLLDWGLVKLVRPAGKYRTIAGSLLGTPVYMSPEQARESGTVDYRTDIYALGVTSYEMLAGAVPFRGTSSIDTLLAHQDEPVPSLARAVPGLPDELVQLIEAMLAKDAGERPTLAAVRAVLKRLRGTQIPTMTAAGLSISQMITVERVNDEQPTVDDNMSMMRTAPKLPRPPPGALPLPAPPSAQMPITTALTTIPGASAPMPVQRTLPPGLRTPLPGTLVPSYPPSSYPHGSIAPEMFPSAKGLLPPTPNPPARPAPSYRWIVIVAAAAIVTGLGVLLAFVV